MPIASKICPICQGEGKIPPLIRDVVVKRYIDEFDDLVTVSKKIITREEQVCPKCQGNRYQFYFYATGGLMVTNNRNEYPNFII